MVIDLRSDTVTKPNAQMREAMAAAVVGDDVYREDPTVQELEQLAAGILGKEAALFVASGTMGNLVALLTHCQPGQEVLLDAESHIFHYEVGGMAALGGLMPKPIKSGDDLYHPELLAAAYREANIHFPTPALLCLENTHNRAGGVVVPLGRMRQAAAWARDKGLKVHLDGARIFNAAIALQVEAAELARDMDSVMFCLSKGMGAPAGSLVVGSGEFIERARKWRKMVGGGMRQVGVLAAAGLVALRERERLAEDHMRARRLAERLAKLEGLTIELDKVVTNIFMVDLALPQVDGERLTAMLAEAGVLVNAVGSKRIRIVTHRDVDDHAVDRAGELIEQVAGELQG